MKKLLCVLLLSICLAGCADKGAYLTKYIVNCESTELRRKPAGDGAILDQIQWGSEVSYVGSAKDGYVKVIYKDAIGYVLSSCVAGDKPTEKGTAGKQNYTYLMSHQVEEASKEQVTKAIEPLCASIDKKLGSYKVLSYGSETLWVDSLGCAKKEQKSESGTNQYYFNTEKNELVFVIVNSDGVDHKLYFQEDKLICYIDQAGETIYNPDDQAVLQMADEAIEQAYR